MVYRKFLFLSLLCFLFTSPVWGQLDNYNPYAPVKEEPPIAADGTINWPTFYKSAKTEARFQQYFQMGSCVGTRKEIVERLKNNTVDINRLPQISVSGRIVKILPGMIGVKEESGKTILIVSHPKGVSHINVSGETSPSFIRPGISIRFTGCVDEHGHGSDVIHSVELVSLNAQVHPTAITPLQTQVIVGSVSKRQGNHLQIAINTGSLKTLSFMIAADTKTQVNDTSLELLALGDQISAKGHIYAGDHSSAERTLFADDLVITKPKLTSSH